MILSPDEAMYLQKIKTEFSFLSNNTIYTNKSMNKYSYKDMYNDLVDRYKTIEILQDLIIEYDAPDVKKLSMFKDRQWSQTYNFITALYGSRKNLINKAFISKCKKVIKEIKE